MYGWTCRSYLLEGLQRPWQFFSLKVSDWISLKGFTKFPGAQFAAKGPNLSGPGLLGPNLPPRGPICRGPICHQGGQFAGAQFAKNGKLGPKKGPICRGPICRQIFEGPNLPGPNLPGPNLPRTNIRGISGGGDGDWSHYSRLCCRTLPGS